ncbi:MAG TPA: TetR/AcrR family transcriptional regulator [Terriglobales bacterium]|nr:TetR/AcrR family transcriptional regulator [Terriglobales bacterium]
MPAVVERTTTKSAEPTSRMAILKAATEEFALKGYAGARTEGIANAAGVNHTLLFYHFKSKEQLYSAVLDTVFSEWNDRVSLALDLEASAKERLLAYVDSYFDFIAEFPLSPKLVQQEHMRQSSTGSEQLHRMVERYVRPVHRKLVALLKEGVSNGDFHDVDIEHCTHSISALIIFYFTGNLAVESLEGAQVRPRRIELRRKAVIDFISRAVFR